MQGTNEDYTTQHFNGRDGASRRAIHNVELSDRLAGERVIEAVRNHLADGTHRVIITSAENELPGELLDHAFDALRFSGLVCAPGSGGEIALLGMSQSHDALVASIPWGTDDALAALLRAARESRLPLMILPPINGGRGE